MNRQEIITQRLQVALAPMHLEVLDESHMHSVPEGAQSHFKVTVVSETFAGEMPVARHRRVNGVLSDLFAEGLHALALHTMTPQEWFDKGGRSPVSPECMGGSKTV